MATDPKEDEGPGPGTELADVEAELTSSADHEHGPNEGHPLLKEAPQAIRIPPALYVVYLSVFIDAFGGLMAIPVLPQIILRAEEQGGVFGLEAGLALGMLSACYQFFSVPSLILTTRAADIYGRRPFFLLGFAGSVVGFLVIAFHAQITPMIVAPMVGRSLGGIFSASPPLAQGYISDIAGTRSMESSTYRAYLGSIFMFALVFAPGFGGGLSELGLAVPFFVSASLALVGLILAYFLLKESMIGAKPLCGKKPSGGYAAPAPAVEMAQKERRTDSVVNADKQMHAIESRILALFFVNGALLNFAFRLFIMMGPLWLNKKFGWGAAMYGFATSMVGCFGILVNTKIYPKIVKRVGKHGCLCLGALISTGGFLVIWASQRTRSNDDPRASSTIAKGPLVYMLGMLTLALGNSMTQSSLSSLIARYAASGNQAGIQGKYRALQAVTGFVAPLMGGYIFDSPAWEASPAMSAGLFFLIFLITRYVIKLNHELHLANPKEVETYPSHSWLELIPGVRNPFVELHYNSHSFGMNSHHPTSTVVH